MLTSICEAVGLDTVVEETVRQLREKAEQNHVSLQAETEPCVLQSEPGLVREIVSNLVENAIKYNVEGGSVKVAVKNGVLTVEDTGIGIPAEQQERVFERFYRVDKSHSRAGGGTGLGLSIVKHACAYLGAAIALQSTPGRGRVVRVTFPRKTQA